MTYNKRLTTAKTIKRRIIGPEFALSAVEPKSTASEYATLSILLYNSSVSYTHLTLPTNREV